LLRGAAAISDPDGYTLLLASAAPLAIGPSLYGNIGYDPATSFAPIALVSSVPYVMIAGPSVTAKTVPEIVAYAKANPGKLNIGVPNGAPPHMIAAWFRALTGTDVVIVPYKGASNVITDLMGGQIDLGFETTSVVFGHVHDSKIRPIGVATAARLPDLPDVPTMIEGGRPRFHREFLERDHGAGRDLERRDPSAQRRHQCRAEIAGVAGSLQEARRRSHARNARGLCRVHRARSSEMAGQWPGSSPASRRNKQ